jgi:APA family basic amino acid/polyamine antiporter
LVDNVDLGRFPTWSDFLIAIPVGMVAYTGIETISNMAEEAKDFGNTIPRAVGGVVIAVAAIYAFLPAVALSAMPVRDGKTELADKYAGDPVLGVVKNIDLGFLQGPTEVYVGILAATILFIATNAGLIGVSRLTYSMGQYRQLPEVLRKLHPKYRTPYVAIIVFGCIACVAILPGQANFLGTIYAFGAMLSFTVAHISVTALRFSQPDRERPYKVPFSVDMRGVSVPVLSVIGGICTGMAWIVVTVLDVKVLISGTAWLSLGVVLYILYRRNQGLSLTQTVKAVQPKTIVEHEVEYQSVLVAFEDNQYDREAVSTAVKVAARRRRGIHILVTITVPNNAPIDAALPQQEEQAQATVDSARVLGGRRVTGHWEKVRPGEAGRRIVDEAKSINARAIVMAPRRRSSGAMFGRTLEYVLAHRPCRVIVEVSPPGQADRSSAPTARAAA